MEYFRFGLRKKEGYEMLNELIFIIVLFFLGSFLQGVSGFGFGLFSMGFLPFMFTLRDSTLLVGALGLVIAFSILVKVYRHLNYRKLFVLLGAALIGRICAYFVLHTYGEMDVMKKILGFVLIAMVIYIYRSKKREVDKDREEKTIIPISMGLLGGFIGGIFMTGGPFFVFYFMIACKDKYSYTANLQATFFITGFFTLVLHGLGGDLKGELLLYIILGIGSVGIGSYLGMRWFERLSQENIKKIASIVLAITGLNLILFL